jgi:hypothetical protein
MEGHSAEWGTLPSVASFKKTSSLDFLHESFLSLIGGVAKPHHQLGKRSTEFLVETAINRHLYRRML